MFAVKSTTYGDSSFRPHTVIGSFEPTPALEAPLDVLLVAPSSLKNLSNLHNVAQSLITPNHTIILIDSTYNIGLHLLIEAQFPNNPVCSISTEATLRLLPAVNDPTSYNRSDSLPLLIHSGHVSKTWLSVPKVPTTALNGLIQSLQQTGIQATASSSFDQIQWNQVILTLAFQPLTVMLETQTPAALLENVLSKPLYMGIITELMEIASKHTGFPYDADYLKEIVNEFKHSSTGFTAVTANGGLTPSPTSSTISSSALGIVDKNPFNPAYLDAPTLFYEYYHGLPIAVDLLLLQPILMASDFGIKTPYLETIFACLTRMVDLNSKKSDSILLQRKTAGAKEVSPTVLSQSSEASARERRLDEREHQLQMREKQLEQREQKLNNWSNTLQRMQNQQPQQQQQPGKPGGYRPASAMPFMGNRGGPPSGQQRPDPNMSIDMMQMTNRRNRRNNSSQMLRTSASTASLTNLADSQQYHASNGGVSNGMASSMSMYRSGSRMGFGREAVSTSDIDSYSSITADRYGTVDARQLSRSRSVMQMAIPETGPMASSPNLGGSASFMVGNGGSNNGSGSSSGSRHNNSSSNINALSSPNFNYHYGEGANGSSQNLSNGFQRSTGSPTAATINNGSADPSVFAEERSSNPYMQFAVNPYSAPGPTAAATDL